MDASPILCGGVTVYKALKNSGIRKDSWVVLPGAAGGLDHLAIQYARAMGFRVVAIDSGAKKVILCNELGADVFIDFAETSVSQLSRVIAEKNMLMMGPCFRMWLMLSSRQPVVELTAP